MPEILFVHGALVRDGAWWWRLVADELQRATGVPSRSLALPSCGEGETSDSEGLVADAGALRAALDDSDGDVLVVGHSYGGTVIAEGADHPAVAQLLYISSYLPDVGTAQGEMMSGEPDPVTAEPRDDGRLGLAGYDADRFEARFLQDVPEPRADVVRDAWARVTPQDASAFLTPTTAAAWQGRTSTYLVCARDRSTTVELQRAHAARATRSVELPTGHHPFISRPDLVVHEIRASLEMV